MARRKDDSLEERHRRFEDFHLAIYKERWPGLREALLAGRNPIAYTEGLVRPYMLDEASVMTASLLPLVEDGRVLDMCAAPGGKTLVLASRLPSGATITANDRSKERCRRMRAVLDEHLPGELRQRVSTSCRDASTWGLKEKDAYDSILLDAPCSSERHVMADEAYMAQWSPSRPKRLAIEQYALLASAFMALKEGGHLLYSTCSINPGEDEEVVAKLFKRHPGAVEEVKTCLPMAEPKTHGALILPDNAGGLGPMYFCLLRKKPCDVSL